MAVSFIKNKKDSFFVWGLILLNLAILILFYGIDKITTIHNVIKDFSFVLDEPSFLRPISSGSIILMEEETGKVLYNRNADALIPPASLTKLVSLYLAYEAIHKNLVKKDQLVPIGVDAWAKMLPTDASRMFLEPGQQVTLLEIMLGLALPSGNDAAIALADFLAGNKKDFIKKMNKTVHSLGLHHMHFEDPNGLSYNNYITARDFANFCRIYVHKFPESITELHSVIDFSYPKKDNWPLGYKGRRREIRQPNHNPLLGRLEGVDGLKTGYIGKSGFNIALSVKRGNMRLIGVILASFASTSIQANKDRVRDAIKLVNFAYSQYRLEHDQLMHSYISPLTGVRATTSPSHNNLVVKQGEIEYIPDFFYENPYYSIKDHIVGALVVKDKDGDVARIPLVSIDNKPPKSLFDALIGFFYDILTAFIKR